LIALLSGILRFNFWFSYSLFLIFIGGILILFIYITSLASNETFKISLNKKVLILIIYLFILLLILSYILDLKSLILNTIKNFENYSLIISKSILITNNRILLNKIFNFPTNLISILIINYLFLTLIATVKITNIFKGPLRPLNN